MNGLIIYSIQTVDQLTTSKKQEPGFEWNISDNGGNPVTVSRISRGKINVC